MKTVSFLVRAATAVLLSAAALAAHAQGVDKDEITLGVSLPLSGPAAEFAQPGLDGARLYVEALNARGGVHGRKLRIVALDDGYSTPRGVENVRQLIERDKVFLVFGVLGTATNLEILPLLERHGVPSVGPGSGSSALRDPVHPLVFHTRAGFEEEIRKTVEHLRIRGITRIGAVWQNNPFGKEALGHLRQAAAASPIRLVAAASVENNATDAARAAQTLSEARVQAVLMFTIGQPSAAFLRHYRRLDAGAHAFMLSPMGAHQTVSALGADGAGVVVSQVVPSPFSPGTQIAREYRAAVGEGPLSFVGMEGFIVMKVIAEGLRRAGPQPTRERFVRAMESMTAYDLGDFVVGFGRDRRRGSGFVELTAISREGRFIR